MPPPHVAPPWLRLRREGAFALALLLLILSAWPTARAATRMVTQRFSVPAPSVLGNEEAAAGAEPREQAIAIWAQPLSAEEKLPVVVAFHGKGESVIGPSRGYAAWVDRYGLGKAYGALLEAPPLTAAAFGGLVRERELAALNHELRARPFRGVLVVGVYTPDLLVEDPDALARYASWVSSVLVPKVQKTFPVASTEPRQVGVDGVSLGGMVALEVGLRHPETFGAVGTMQPAIRGREAALAELAARARNKHPQQLRLLSSDGDPLLSSTKALSRELRKRRLSHQLIVTPGGHDYAFNRGPGAIELLHFHDRALREPAREP